MMLDLINFKSCMTHLTHRALRTHLRAKTVRRSAKTTISLFLTVFRRHLCSMKVIQVYFWLNHFFKRCFILVCDADADLKLNLKLPAIQCVKGNSESIFDLCIWCFSFLLICLDDVTSFLHFSGVVLLILLWAGSWECGAGESMDRRGGYEKSSRQPSQPVLICQSQRAVGYLSAN